MPSDATLLLVDKHVVEQLLVPDDVIAAVREAFELHGRQAGRVFPVVREKLNTGGIFGIKSGDVGSQDLLGFKAAGFWPSNRSIGGEAHQATVLLFDPATGRPLCVIDGNAITTARTAAAGALGLSLLARQDTAVATVFGTGIQAKAQLAFALRTLPSLTHVNYVSLDREPQADFESLFADQCMLRCAVNADEAVAQSDLIITATTGSGPLFDETALRAGTHLNCVGADTRGKRELPVGVLDRARIVVDDLEQARELGELQWAPQTPSVEMGDLLTGHAQWRRDPTDISVFDMTGLALQDLTVARLIHRRATDLGLGVTVAWPW
ncbi:ornithine cyclodeaminase/alanine dehydrogenase-like protein (mu-crystallin family) [Paraburkholderia youngii]|uniref:Ornithine cyclodeaminase n=1 Tax=Paraburkholderia youngii TaxID=2782701 RepID=A0A7W8L7N5_9BURK|nr:ornithine cyclodeaminase family protein [Paraburkholderia youngii]MBB5401620.1 ornithine cyclodeaminase [Paraburkholderia youngii]NVI09376.1 ornithine cyclodeaminase family protein [Paraburkholderia youngii]